MTRGQALGLLALGSLVLFICSLVAVAILEDDLALVGGSAFFIAAAFGWCVFTFAVIRDVRSAGAPPPESSIEPED